MEDSSKQAAQCAPTDSPDAFAAALVNWFVATGEDFPWRRTHDPYAVLVSELMLQQTQVATVLRGRYFERWMEQFPDISSLADAETELVLKAWEGLGYYRRARNLQQAARHIRDAFGGQFPKSLAELESLPGVGRYTAGAVVSFAFGHPAPLVDANVARVFSRLFAMRDAIDSTPGQRRLWEHASALVPAEGAREFNSGLMELGQKICTPNRPLCTACPVATWCLCHRPDDHPRKKPKKATQKITERVFLARRAEDGHLLVERELGSRRTGLFRLPTAGEDATGWPVLLTTSYSITRYRVTLTCLGAPDGYQAPLPAGEDSNRIWCSPDEVETIPMGAPYRKMLRRLLHEPTLKS